jgi:hypothetical protein
VGAVGLSMFSNGLYHVCLEHALFSYPGAYNFYDCSYMSFIFYGIIYVSVIEFFPVPNLKA